MGRPVTLTARRLNRTKSKLFRFNPFPLYLVGKLKDNSKINNIMITERSANGFEKTTSPKLSVSTNSNGSLDNAGGNALNDREPPPNFTLVDRLSSAKVDVQNLSPL